MDTCGNCYFSFSTNSTSLAVKASCDGGYCDSTYNGINFNSQDVFLARFSSGGALQWASYFGGDGHEFRSPLETDLSGNLYLSGEWTYATSSGSYPLADPGSGAYYDNTFNNADDGYISKFVFNAPAPSFSYAIGICANVTSVAAVTAPGFSSGGTFSATPGLSVHASSGRIYPSASQPGTYTVTYQLASCNCAQTLQVLSTSTAVIHPVPTITIAGSSTICSGDPTSYSATGASSYTWSNGPFSNTTLISPLTNTILSVTGQDSNGCISTTSLLINVVSYPIVSGSGSSVIVTAIAWSCPGAELYLILGVTAPPPAT